MKKVFSILLVAFAMTAMVACGDENNNGGTNNGGGNNGGTEQPTGGDEAMIAGGNWGTPYTEPGTLVSVIFQSHYNATGFIQVDDLWVRKTEIDSQGYDISNIDWDGKYTYSGTATSGNGAMKLYVVGETDTVRATFSIGGGELTLNLQGETYKLQRNN